MDGPGALGCADRSALTQNVEVDGLFEGLSLVPLLAPDTLRIVGRHLHIGGPHVVPGAESCG